MARAVAQKQARASAERCQEKNNQRPGIALFTKGLAPELAMDSDTLA